MKLTSLFIAATTLLFIGACSEDNGQVDSVAEEIAAVTEEVAETTDEVAKIAANAALIDPNTASADVIAAIPGVGTDLAQQVISGRPYSTPSALHAVLKDTVDEDGLKTIYSTMFVTVNLNTGNSADYELIPTTLSPKKLAHEFEEYRPYTSIEQFAREMSKYVSAVEVANLQRYVTID